jgi:hypothetical protein
VREAEEYFSPGQKGSSAMPHKRNPVLTENLTGLARLVRGMVIPALENVALWHERDISHSSVERMIGPDATVTLDFALARLTGVIDKLLVYPDACVQRNLDRLGGAGAFAARAARADPGRHEPRGRLWPPVQRNAMKSNARSTRHPDRRPITARKAAPGAPGGSAPSNAAPPPSPAPISGARRTAGRRWRRPWRADPPSSASSAWLPALPAPRAVSRGRGRDRRAEGGSMPPEARAAAAGLSRSR